MVTEELTRLMHSDAKRHGGALDLEQIHRLGRRRRWSHRAATGAVVCAAVAAVGGVWLVLGPGGGPVNVRAAGQDHQVTGLTTYEKKALAEVPGSYEVDGTVVLPDRDRDMPRLARPAVLDDSGAAGMGAADDEAMVAVPDLAGGIRFLRRHPISWPITIAVETITRRIGVLLSWSNTAEVTASPESELGATVHETPDPNGQDQVTLIDPPEAGVSRIVPPSA